MEQRASWETSSHSSEILCFHVGEVSSHVHLDCDDVTTKKNSTLIVTIVIRKSSAFYIT